MTVDTEHNQQSDNSDRQASDHQAVRLQPKRQDYAAPRLKRSGDLEKITHTTLARMFFY